MARRSPHQPVDGAALALGRAAGAALALPRSGRRGRLAAAATDPRRAPRASSGRPRRSAKPVTFRTRTLRSSAMVTTSPGRTGRLAAPIRAPLSRTRPPLDQLRGIGAGAHHPRVPQPLVDALPVRRSAASAPCWPRAVPSAPGAWRTANSDRPPCRAGRSPELQVRRRTVVVAIAVAVTARPIGTVAARRAACRDPDDPCAPAGRRAAVADGRGCSPLRRDRDRGDAADGRAGFDRPRPAAAHRLPALPPMPRRAALRSAAAAAGPADRDGGGACRRRGDCARRTDGPAARPRSARARPQRRRQASSAASAEAGRLLRLAPDVPRQHSARRRPVLP